MTIRSPKCAWPGCDEAPRHKRQLLGYCGEHVETVDENRSQSRFRSLLGRDRERQDIR